MPDVDLAEVAHVLAKFARADLGLTLAGIERSVQGLSAATCADTLASAGVSTDVLAAAASLKRIAGQVTVAIHAAGILLCLPHILEPDLM